MTLRIRLLVPSVLSVAMAVALAVSFVPGAVASDPVPDIVGGTEVDPPGAYPFMAALVRTSDLPDAYSAQFCGGSLVAPDTVLTAAHCVALSSANEPSEVAVVVGRHVLRDDGAGEVIGVTDIAIHPDYRGSTLENDVALLTLERAAVLGTPVPLALPDDADRYVEATQATVVGWGSTLGIPSGTPNYPNRLREVSVPVIPDIGCADSYGTIFYADTMMCAGFDDGGVDSCSGDSGGPLFVVDTYGFVQVGVVSWGVGCALEGFPGVYAEVAAFDDWLIGLLEPDIASCIWLPVTHGGSPGDDDIDGSPGNDVIDAGAGDDIVRASDGDDVVCGGEGVDMISGERGRDRLLGGGGDDVVAGNMGADQLLGGSGDDELVGGPGHDRIDGGSGVDALFGRDGDDVLDGGPDADDLRGNDGSDLLLGGQGSDHLDGGVGDDTLAGEAGEDMLIGGWGDDVLDGGSGDDLIRGNPGSDEISGGPGRDTIAGGNDPDVIRGGDDDDDVRGGRGDDDVDGGGGSDVLRGGDDDDMVRGRRGPDLLVGGRGDDRLFGGTGDDRVFGNDGADLLRGGAGTDELVGGPGVDTCVTGESVDCEV